MGHFAGCVRAIPSNITLRKPAGMTQQRASELDEARRPCDNGVTRALLFLLLLDGTPDCNPNRVFRNTLMKRILHPRRDVADGLAISLRKLDQLVNEKLIKVVKIGRKIFVSDAGLQRFARRGTGGRDGQ
jgi:hypothetical protein